MTRQGPRLGKDHGKECWGQCEKLGKSSGPRLKYGLINQETLDRQNSVKMTEKRDRKIGIPSLIKVGYFLSILKFLDLNSKISSQPF